MVARVSFSWTYMPCLTNNDVFMGWFLSVEQENIANIGTSYYQLAFCRIKQLFLASLLIIPISVALTTRKNGIISFLGSLSCRAR